MGFSPVEVDSYAHKLLINCANAAPDASEACVLLSARSERPYCHMEVEESTYLSHGRRSPDMPGPDGSLTPLDPDTKCIEFESLGTKASTFPVPSSHTCISWTLLLSHASMRGCRCTLLASGEGWGECRLLTPRALHSDASGACALRREAAATIYRP